MKHLKNICFIVFMASSLGTQAQDNFTNILANVNYLDSVNIKRLKNRIDSSLVHIELNKITGIASFYSSKFEGHKTASGSIFKNKDYTAACNLFKLNTLVRVTHLINGKSVIVRINDRMHPKTVKRGRVIDLSQAAAKKLIINTRGLAKVSVEAIGFSKINPK